MSYYVIIISTLEVASKVRFLVVTRNDVIAVYPIPLCQYRLKVMTSNSWNKHVSFTSILGTFERSFLTCMFMMEEVANT